MRLRRNGLRRALVVGAGLLLGVAGFSYARALLAPNSPGWDLRSAEWLRENHLGWALDLAEWAWFSVHEPTAHEPDTRLSVFPAPFARQGDGSSKAAVEPPPIRSPFPHPLPDEGVWHGIGSTINGVPALRTAFFRPDPDQPQLRVAVARFTPELTRFVLVPGVRDPGGDWSWRGTVPEGERSSLLAAFNAGFRLFEAHGGIYAEGREARPLVADAASLVIDRQGVADIVAWRAEREPSPDIVAVRQNLRLIVVDGQAVPGLDHHPFGAWSKRSHDGPMWRSGLGVTPAGAIFYLAGRGLTLGLLARALAEAGAVRAMELDIHQQWPSFNVFQPASARDPKLIATKLLPDMRQPAERYLTPDDRDFVAVFVR